MVALRIRTDNDYVVNLKHHHTQCELNFHLMMGLVPNCRESALWQFHLDDAAATAVVIQRIDEAPFTTTLEITQVSQFSVLSPPKIQVRLYHDVEMAEVVAWDNHRHWQPVYSYPNKRMYQRDEKLALNRFLGEWLVYCRKLGLSSEGFVNPLP